MPAKPVDVTPSAINLFSKGGVYDASETGTAFRDAEDRPVESLEGGAVVASDWAGLRQKPCVHSLYVVAARWNFSARPSALAGNTHTGSEFAVRHVSPLPVIDNEYGENTPDARWPEGELTGTFGIKFWHCADQWTEVGFVTDAFSLG